MSAELLCIAIGRLSIVFTTTSIVFVTPSVLTLSSSNCVVIECVLETMKTVCFATPATALVNNVVFEQHTQLSKRSWNMAFS